MKRIAILAGLALLANVGPVLAQGARGGSYAASAARPAAGSVAGVNAARHGGGPGGHSGHHHGHPRPPVAVVFPWWWHLHYGYRPYYSSPIVVTAPIYVPIYTPVPVPASGEPSSDLRYYCPDYRDYYPNVATCPSQWLQVVPGPVGTSY